MNELRLYIGNTQVELGKNPSILYSYIVTDYSNPTAVKNSFSKTITVEGTPTNNKIFGHYWNLEKLAGNGGPNAGVDFNASKKAPFQLFVGSELYEEGYVRLDKINKLGKVNTYDITLFGGLGDYFYSLSFNPNTGDKLKLADLDYYTGGTEEFNFVTTASTVYEAWEALRNGTEGKWQHINFMPAYNGYPDDFDADKVIINLEGTGLKDSDQSGFYRPTGGCVIADLPQEMTEWEMRDLRSYLQRPCVRMKSIIDACCNPDQNGGYEVELDEDFFNENNPYYEKTWLSLPLVKNLEYANEEQVLTGAKLVGLTTTGDVGTLMYQNLKFDIGDYGSSTPSNITMSAKFYVNNPWHDWNSEIYPELEELTTLSTPYTSYVWFYRKKGDGYHNKWFCLGSLFVQMIAMNGDVVVGASDAYNLTTPIRHNGKLIYGNNSYYSPANQFKPYMDAKITDVFGEFHTDGFHREGQNTPAELTFRINNINGPVSQLKVVYFWGATDAKINNKFFSKTALFDETEYNALIDIGDNHIPNAYMTKQPWTHTVGVTNTDFQAVLGASLGRTGTNINKALLLNTKDSPADYLLSYGKMFGLYFTKTVGENKIKIETRKTFYHRDEVVNLNELIDRGKDIKINPLAFDTKWYQLSQEMDETDFQQKYMSSRGVDYGCKVLNTGYEFNVEKKNLLENNVIRSGIEGLERSKYFSAFNNDNSARSWMYMGLHYNLYFGEETYGVDVSVRNNNDLVGINENEGMKYYDVFPKLQFHAEENDPTDGNNVLVFFSGFKDMVGGRTNPLSYYLSDDNMYQTLLNESTPCWFFTANEMISGTQFATKVRYLPVFERYLTNESSGKVNKSLDFGTSQELYVPDYNITEESNIYYNFWKEYLEDLFDVNTKVLTCYVKSVGKINDEWMRRFYWFDNAIWRLNKVTDWNVSDDTTTQMEFIKVQNVNGYNSITQVPSNRITLTSSAYRVSTSGDSVTLSVSILNGGSWRLTSTEGVVLSTSTGTGDGEITATFPSNNGEGLVYWFFTVSSIADGETARITIVQGYEDESGFDVNPSSLIIPASGADIEVEFIWRNQGSNYIYTTGGNSGIIPFTADTATRRADNRALLHFGENTGNTVLSDSITFYNENGSVHNSITLNQLPAEFIFPASGGSSAMTFNPSAVTFENVPDWIAITESGDSYTVAARENVTDSPKEAMIGVSNPQGSSASFMVLQESGTGESHFTVNPTNIYFDASGGSRTVSVTSDYSWFVNDNPNFTWGSISPIESSGNGIITITASENDSTERSVQIVVSARGEGGVYINKNIIITQAAQGTTGITMTVTADTQTIDPTGQTVTYTVTVSNMTDLYLSVSAMTSDSALTGTVVSTTWSGNVGTVVITYPANPELTSKTWNAVFTLTRGASTVATETVSHSQSGSGTEFFNLNETTVNHPATGATTVLSPSSNTCWYTEISGTPTPDAIGFENPSWAINNLIDTGIYPDDNTTVRVKYQGRGVKSDRRVGTIDGYGGCDDEHDWRFFDIFNSRIYFDIGEYRLNVSSISDVSSNGVEYDLTMGNAYLYDNNAGDYILSGTPQSITTAYTICMDVGTVWVREVTIEKNGVVVFHGKPYKNGGVVGLYDDVSNSVKTLYSGSSGSIIASASSQSVDWLTVTSSGCSSDTLTITTDLNVGDTRTATIYIYSQVTGDLLKTITVVQQGGGAILSVSPSVIYFDSNGGTATFTITSNINWTIQ